MALRAQKYGAVPVLGVEYGPPFGQQMDLRARGYLRITIRFALMRAQPTQSTRFLGFFQINK
ncbi:BQ5605_C011g06605 [Microbotryum silenes-dioicae]|uniref:BQ5605_C011g06605 protein n=1 Tax=Microbotryum silenes-dioicae TaxID=796604 RepID=A0A2X0MAL7_9BASI|nr:BQ5605_C011g06605 [Microbotryum silenes-dioicae]